MAAPTEIYVDPSIAGDSGAGTSGDPYGDVQYALDTVTRDATNGDRFNIKAGTDEILTAALDFTTYGTAAAGAPVIFQGYTSAAGDGGIGGISGNGSYGVFSSTTYDNVWCRDMHLHNSGAANIVRLDDICYFINCEINNSTASGLYLDNYAKVVNCYIHNVAVYGVRVGAYSHLMYNYIGGGANTANVILYITTDGFVLGNVFNVQDSFAYAIDIQGDRTTYLGNTIIATNSATGDGFRTPGANSALGVIIANNVIQGFSGAGGTGINVTGDLGLSANNAFYNNTTNESIGGATMVDLGGDQVLTSSPFVDAANDDVSVDTTLKALGWPSSFYGASTNQFLDIGAAQRKERSAKSSLHLGVS